MTFTDVTLSRPSGYGINLWCGSGGSSSDLTFTNLTIDATGGNWCLQAGYHFSNIAFHNLTLKAVENQGPAVMLADQANNITFDGFTASGGYQLLDVLGGHLA